MKKSIILLAYVVISFIYVINLWFTVGGFFLFFTSVFILGIFIFFSDKFKVLPKVDYYTLISFVLILFVLVSFVLEATDVNGLQSIAMWIGRLLMFTSTLVSVFYIIDAKSVKIFTFIGRNKFIIMLILSFLIQLSLLKIVKVPDVDIYRITKYGPLQLLSGQNPYVSSGGNYEAYTYGPASVFLFAPFDFVLHDPRYLLILSNFFVAFALYKISRMYFSRKEEAEILSLLYLFHPRYANLLNSTSTDVVIVGLLALALLGFASKRIYWFGIGLGLLFGVKILYAVPFLFLLKYRNFPFRKTFIAGAVTLLLLYVPFLISNSNAFIYSSILFHFKQTETLFLQKAVVTLGAFINRQWSYFPSSNIFMIVNLITVTLLWLKIKSTNKFDGVLVIIGFVFLICLFLSQQALPGYYFVASSLLLFALSFSGKNEKIVL